MKKLFACLLGILGINSACGQHNYESLDPEGFEPYTRNPDVVLLDVRGADEYLAEHIDGAINIDVNSSDFTSKAQARVPAGATVAVYCLGGIRSARAADRLDSLGYKVVNLNGGIRSWMQSGKPVTADTHERDVFVTDRGRTLRFYALLHASIRLVVDDVEIEIDPVGKLGNRTTDYSLLPHADYVFVTHEHGDHFDKAAIAQVSTDGTRLLTNSRCADMLGYGQALANGDTTSLPHGIAVEAIPAYNTTEGHTQFHPKGRDNGFVLTIDNLRIYIAGDTEDISEMAGLGDIDIAFLPCNQPYTMTTDQLVKAARMVRPKVLFPYHYGQTDVSGISDQLKADGIDVRIRHYE